MFNAGLLREPTLPFYPLQVGANMDSLHADGVSVFLFFLVLAVKHSRTGPQPA